MQDIFENVKLKSTDTKNEILQFIKKFPEHNHEDNINIDISDVKTILDSKGTVAIYTSEQVGSSSAIETILNEISPVNKLNAALFLFEVSDKYEISKLIKLVDMIYDLGDDDTSMIFGTVVNETFKVTQMKFTLIINIVEDKEVVLKAVESDGRTLQFASRELKKRHI